MPVNSTDTYDLVRKIEQRRPPMSFYMARYFGSIMQFDTEEVHFDEVLGDRRMAPFVSPLVEGKAMRDKGHTMKLFRPAYLKPKHIVDPTKALKRLPGESFGGSMSPEQRMSAKVAENFMKEDEMIDNRLEWMCLEVLKNASVTISGIDYPSVSVDYGRDANNTVALAGVLRWNDTSAEPLTDLEDLSTQMATADFGAPATDVMMDPLAYQDFRKHADVKELMDTNFRGTESAINRAPVTFNPESAPMLMGYIGQFAIWVDSRQYTNDVGAVVPYLAAGDVLLLSGSIEGVQAFGAILDIDVMRAMQRFPKTWTTPDPSARYTMTQSAPLPIAARPNASAYLKTRG